jgi:hypothetical protein
MYFGGIAMKVEFPKGKDALSEFILFQDRVYENRSIRWPAELPHELALLMGESATCEDRTFCPILVREGADIVARAVAVLDTRYNRHWNERLGHIIRFEAMPGTREAVRTLMDAACEWLKDQAAAAARIGWLPLTDMPFVVDDYESLPPILLRHNPAYYHRLLKDAGFETECGFVDYKMQVTPELTARYESALEAARRGGFEIVPISQIPEKRRVAEFTDTFNDAFRFHWGQPPISETQFAEAFLTDSQGTDRHHAFDNSPGQLGVVRHLQFS